MPPFVDASPPFLLLGQVMNEKLCQFSFPRTLGSFSRRLSLSQLSFVALFDSERRVLSRGVTKGWLYLFF